MPFTGNPLTGFGLWAKTEAPGKEIAGTKKSVNTNRYVVPFQLTRLKHDTSMWRQAIDECEQPYYPFRVKVMRMLQDTRLNGHVGACMQKRKDLTLLKEFEIVDDKDNPIEDATIFLKDKRWFHDILNYILDAQAYGYTLLNFGDIVNGDFENVQLVKRENISPDNCYVGSFPYMPSGWNFLEKPLSDWTLWVPTPSEAASSKCGFGYLYSVANYEIILRNILGFNTTFAEVYGMPLRVGKTDKDDKERDFLEEALQQLGSSGYGILDKDDEIEFVESSKSGSGWQTYANLEKRCEAKISKIILGHADAMDSVPGKIGSSQGDDNPVEKALKAKQSSDKTFAEYIVNNYLLPKLRNLGFPIPEFCKWKIKNDEEREEIKNKTADFNKKVADICLIFSQAGKTVPTEWVKEQTGIDIEDTPLPEPPTKPNLPESISNKLAKIYGEHKDG